jgi:hypothetical protein
MALTGTGGKKKHNVINEADFINIPDIGRITLGYLALNCWFEKIHI